MNIQRIQVIIKIASRNNGCMGMKCRTCALSKFHSICNSDITIGAAMSQRCREYINEHPDIFTPEVIMETLL